MQRTVIARKATRAPARKAQAVLDGYSVLNKHMRAIDGPKGITPERLATMAMLMVNGPVAIGELARMANVRPATMSRMISAMSDDDLIQRWADKSDGRGVLISLTRKGKRTYAQANQKSLQVLEESLNQLTESEIETLLKLGKALASFYKR